MKNVITPKTANTFNKICKLERDNVSTRYSWMLLGGSGDANKITICNQKPGSEKTGSISLTKKEFERFIRFYETGK